MITTRTHRGFSLISLMIALVLGLMLISVIFSAFSGNRQSTDLTTTMSDMQESARFAIHQLSNDIRMAGFQGCNDIRRGGPTILANDAPTTNLSLTATTGSLVNTNSSWSPDPALGSTIPTQNLNAIPGTHALSIQFGSQATYPLSQNVGNGSAPNRTAPIQINISEGISSEAFNMQAGEYAIISNCLGGDLIRISSVSSSPTVARIEHTAAMNTKDSLSLDYIEEPNTKFMRFNSNVYYVGDTGSQSTDGTPVSGLYKQSLPYDASNPPVLMVKGVENMRVLFGYRTGTSTLSFSEPDASGLNASNIESIQIGLLMVSESQVTSVNDNKTYILAGQPIVAATGGSAGVNTHARDKRLRLAFNTTVRVRNRRTE